MTNEAEHLSVIEGDTPPGTDPLVGTTIDGRYLVEKVLGEGGMGLVYLAKHIVLGKSLAVKVLRPDVSRDEEIITRFRQEAQSASSIGNQHIIDISDFGTLPDGSTYFIMEFLEGVDLTGAIEAEPSGLDPARVLHVAKQLADALGAAHDNGIVHRDLKPDNIYLIKRGNDTNFVKVLDFGIAKVGGSSSKLTRAGQVFGTPHYMSPEQCAGSGVDHRTDIYAIGVIMYEMLTGMVPFDADNLMGILTKHLYEQPAPPSAHNPNVPAELEQVVLRCMTKVADDRYQTMYEFKEDLQRIEAGIAPMPAPAPSEHTGHFNTGQHVTQAGIPAAQTKSKAPLAIAVVLLLLAGGAGAFFALGGTEEQATPPPVVTPPIAAAPTPAPEPEPEPEAEPEATPEPVRTVRIVSTPAGAQVFSGEGEFIGTTPIDVPRPPAGESLPLELRLVGYENFALAISERTIADEVPITLQEASRRSGRSGSRRGGRPAASGSMMAPAAAPMTTPAMRPRTTSELQNPWG